MSIYVLYVLGCIVLCGIVWFCIVLYCIVLYCIVLYCIVFYCIVLYCMHNPNPLNPIESTCMHGFAMCDIE